MIATKKAATGNNEFRCHLASNAFLLQDERDCDYECHLADGKGIKMSRVHNVR